MAEDQPSPDPDEQRARSGGGAEVPAADALPEIELVPEADTERLETRARAAEDRLTEVVEAYRKLKTDNDAYRDRTTRNLERRFEQRRESLLLKFMDILDNMDRALDAAQTAYADASLLEGLILVRTQLLQTLQDEGLERIPVLGLAFDPHVSEAVQSEKVDDPDQNGIVVKELLRGYRLNGRVARPSRVVVAEYPGGAAAATAEPAAEPETPAPGAEEPAALGELSLEDIIARAEEAQAAAKPPAGGKR